MVQREMLAPAAALAVWTVAMLVWTWVVGGRAFTKAGLSTAKLPPGSRGKDLDGRIPAEAQWPSHNYSHLLEQPTAFYPVVIMLALVGPAAADIALAWAYVVLRVSHSLWQAIVNRLPLRFALFFLSSACLATLAVRALFLTRQ